MLNQAKAKVNALLKTNQARMNSYVEVTKAEADGYQVMMKDLGYSKDNDILDYIKVKAVGGYN